MSRIIGALAIQGEALSVADAITLSVLFVCGAAVLIALIIHD
jgi:hypothetical protein